MQFYYIYRYLYNENIDLPSVMTALTTLYAAHKYMCPGLAKEVIILQIPFKTSICNRIIKPFIIFKFLFFDSFNFISGGVLLEEQFERKQRITCTSTYMLILLFCNGINKIIIG